MSRITAADRIWLDLERTENPITITGVIEFDGVLPEHDLHRLMRDRVLKPHPRFGCRAVRHGRHWSWESVPDLDLRAHIHRIGLPDPGDDRSLHRVVGQLMSTRLDPDRPLWQLHLVDRPDGRSALVARLHHAIADGISLARVLMALADGDEGASFTDGPLKGPAAWLRGVVDAVETPEARWALAGRVARSALSIGELAMMPAEADTPIRGPLGTHKAVSWTEGWPLSELKGVARAAGGTVNDVVLATLAGALRRHLLSIGSEPVPLRTFVPVNLRPLDRPLPRDLGNRFGLVIVPLPVDASTPAEAIRAVRRTMDGIKASPAPVVTWAALQTLGAAPDAITNAGVGWFARTASSITTNVPGPREPIALAGIPVQSMMFWVPQSGGVGLGLSIFSYAGTLRVGVASDTGRVADPASIVEHWRDAFAALREAVGG